MDSDSESTIKSNEIYNELDNNEEEQLIDEDSIDENITNNEAIKQEEKKICGFNKFKEEVSKLDEDSFDKTSEYSYETIPDIKEEKKAINYLYIISFLIGLFLIYYFYSGNIFITIIELLLNITFPYIYIVTKLFLIKNKLVQKIKQHNK
tara:strand:- start:126 stop:575 length:450 start_codon:yes stop_codon:yes gene_type:complete